MFKKFDGIIVDEVICYEETVKMKLPKDYKEFLLDTNGGQFIDEIHMFWVDELKENIGIDVLFGFNQVRSLCLNSWYNEYGEELPEETIIIGNSINAGLILLIWQDDWKGVFLWDHGLELEQSTEEDCLYTFGLLVSSMYLKTGLVFFLLIICLFIIDNIVVIFNRAIV